MYMKKAFNQYLTSRYSQKFEIGKIYEVEGKIKWGSSGNGFHMCSDIEDCFR